MLAFFCYYYSDLCKCGMFVCVILCLVAEKMEENGNLGFDVIFFFVQFL